MTVNLKEGSKAFECYRSNETTEEYYCNFGINPAFKEKLEHNTFRISGVDQDNEIRIIELVNHRFFISTLFVPQTNSTEDQPHPIIERFVLECIK